MSKNFSPRKLERIVEDAVTYWERDKAPYGHMDKDEFQEMVEDLLSDAAFYPQPEDWEFETWDAGRDVFVVFIPRDECVWQVTQAVRDRYGYHPSMSSQGAIPVVYGGPR